MLEANIQANIVKFLLPYRKQGLLEFFSVPNEAASNPIRQGQLIATGLRPGVADLVLLFPKSKTLFIEVKNEKGVQRPEQKKFEETCKKLGFPYYLVRSVNEVKTIIENFVN